MAESVDMCSKSLTKTAHIIENATFTILLLVVTYRKSGIKY